MRLFYALLPSEREKQQLQMQQRKISAAAESGRDTATENLHMTLQFLGEVPPERLGLLKEILTQVAQNMRPFSITLRDYGWFDGKGQKRLWYLTGSSPEACCTFGKIGRSTQAKWLCGGKSRFLAPYYAGAALPNAEGSSAGASGTGNHSGTARMADGIPANSGQCGICAGISRGTDITK